MSSADYYVPVVQVNTDGNGHFVGTSACTCDSGEPDWEGHTSDCPIYRGDIKERSDYNVSCPGCDAQVVIYDWGWNCSMCDLDSEKYAETLLIAADIHAHELGRAS